MNYILKLCGKISTDHRKQSKIFLLFTSVLSIIIGFLIWLVIKTTVGASIITLICAVGYALIFLGLLGGILFLMNKNIW